MRFNDDQETAEEDAMAELVPQGSPARGSIEQDRRFEEFVRQVRASMEGTAVGKGYSDQGVDGQNQLFSFVQSFAGDRHALGEVVYKAKRYAAKGDPVDLIKIAAWAFLAWRHRA